MLSAYPLEVALSVHNLATFISSVVSIQVDWLAAHRAGKFLLGGSVRCTQGSLLPLAARFTHLCGIAQLLSDEEDWPCGIEPATEDLVAVFLII